MVKRLLSLVTILAVFCCFANAQQLKKCDKALPLKYQKIDNARKMLGSKVNKSASSDGEIFTYAQGNGIGIVGAGKSHYDCAIFVPGIYAGNKISEIGFYIVDKSAVSNVSYWIAESLPASASSSTCAVYSTVTVSDDLLTTRYPTVGTADYTIPAEGCYVGYSFTANPQSQYGYYCMAFDGMGDIEGGAFANMGTGWQDMYGQGFGNLLTLVLMSGDNFFGNAASLSTTSFSTTAAIDGTGNVRLTLMNYGLNPIKSLSYTVKDVTTGTTSAEQTADVDDIAFCQNSGITLSLSGDAVTGSADKEITITKINGATNEYADAVTKAEGSVFTVTRSVPRKVVVEELTATGCHACPRGYAGMKALTETYPDDFIGIAAHGSVNYYDPMETTAYDAFTTKLTQLYGYNGWGYPSAYVNRNGNYLIYDPYYGSSSSTPLGILDDVDAMRGNAQAEITLSPQWNEDQTAINMNTDVTFLYDDDDDAFAVSYVLVADGLQGSESYWWQYNGLHYGYGNGQTGEPYLDEWLTKGEPDNLLGQTDIFVKDMVYDHVALASVNLMGTKTTFPAPVVKEQKLNDVASIDVSNGIQGYFLKNELIQDKSKLKVVAMLINTKTGEIVNADEKEIAAYDPTGIETVTSEKEDAVEVARYALDGSKLSQPAKGVNIVKMSDGTTKKVIVK